jgi:hypothetical protein
MVFDAWAEVAARHVVWGQAPASEAVRDRTVALVRRLAAAQRDASDDPWSDPGFALRLAARLGELVPRELEFTPDEAARLVAAPFVYDALWRGLAAAQRGVHPADLTPSQDASSERAAFERFAQTYAQPYRRAVAAARAERTAVGRDIGWWLLHRWVGRRPAAYEPAALKDLVEENPEDAEKAEDADNAGSTATAAGADIGRFAELLRAMRGDPGFVARTDRPGALRPRHGAVREQLLGFLLAVARALALETTALPEVIGEHLGIADPVTPAQVLDTAQQAAWEPRGATVVLSAACAHPSIEVALRAHVDTLNQLLAEAHRMAARDETLAPLASLPARIATDHVAPAVVDGRSAYQSAGVRFRLAEDRVQELLMGEQLYGDPALAIRELYQNALDACRYREARTEYLRRAEGLTHAWEGRIRFTQGVDADGRPYLDCVDNGIGMGVRELSEVFSQAGVRLADLPEFLEEQAEWARLDPPVQLFPNSRFGIGVLSYFMLADEITVDTCRMRRDGHPGERLRVSIAGPGSLFRIHTTPPSAESNRQSGTTVRLHLRDGLAVSVVDTLRDVLWVAEFHTDAEDGLAHQAWRPGELAESARDQDDDEHATEVIPAGDARVWWCRTGGALLADGLTAGRTMFGAVVNLNRELAPRLSVDRTKMLGYREEDVDTLLFAAVPALTAPAAKLIDFAWLGTLAETRPLIADLILEEAIARGNTRWEMDEGVADAAVTGCFTPSDASLLGPEELVEWRLTALAAGGQFRKVLAPTPEWRQAVRARPSDAVLLSCDVNATSPWLDPVDLVPLVHLVRAARRSGRTTTEVAARLSVLGYNPAVGADTVGTDPDDLLITSFDIDGRWPWLDPAQPIRLLHLLRAVHRTGRPAHELVTRLRQLGFTVDIALDTLPATGYGPKDLVITSRDIDAAQPWIDPAEPVPLMHLVRCAHKLSLPVADVAARLALLGYELTPGWPGLQTEPDDLLLLARDLDGVHPWLDPDKPVAPIHLLRGAERTGRPVREVAARLRALGCRLNVDVAALDQVKLEPDDVVMASRDLDGSLPWIESDRPVPLFHLLRAADVTGRELPEVIARLSACGYPVDVDPDTVLIDRLEPDDLVFVSEDSDGTDPWLDPARAVPMIHIHRAAQRTRRTIHDVAARLAFLGYPVSSSLEEAEPDDLLITSRDLDGTQPWIDMDEPVPLPHLLQAARRVRRPVREVAARLERLGYTIDSDLALVSVEAVTASDLALLSVERETSSRQWLDASLPVPLLHLVHAAQKVRQPVGAVADRLRMLGYSVPDLDLRLPRLRPGGA